MQSRTRVSESLEAVRTLARDRSHAHLSVVRRQDLLNWGIAESDIRCLLRRKIWRQIRFGVYADATLLQTASSSTRLAMHTVGAIIATTEPAVAYAASAAVLHELPLPQHFESIPWILRPTKTDTRSLHRDNALKIQRPDLRVVTHDFNRLQMTEIEGIPTVDDLHAAVTTSTVMNMGWSVALLDSVLWGQPDRAADVQAAVDEWPFLRGIGHVRKAARLARSGAQTPFESLSRVALMSMNLPEPQLQVPFYDADGLIGYADMYWESLRVIGEADGAVKYATREDLILEKQREDRLRRAGFGVVRWMWSDIMNSPERVAAEIRAAGAAGRSAGRSAVVRVS